MCHSVQSRLVDSAALLDGGRICIEVDLSEVRRWRTPAGHLPIEHDQRTTVRTLTHTKVLRDKVSVHECSRKPRAVLIDATPQVFDFVAKGNHAVDHPDVVRCKRRI